MKFMQRGHEAEIREEAKKEREKIVKESQWTVSDSLANSVVFVEETSMVKDQLGRKSFAKFNQDIERLQEAEKRRQRQEREKTHQNIPKASKTKIAQQQDTPDVSDADMTEQFIKNKKRLNTMQSDQPAKKMKVGDTKTSQ